MPAANNNFSTETYGYDVMSRLITIDRTNDGKPDQFGYDWSSEMTSAKYDLVNNVNPSRSVSYGLDNVGNRTSVTGNGVTTVYVSDNIICSAAVIAAFRTYYEYATLTESRTL